jgi:SAM-dependent methyltransferase
MDATANSDNDQAKLWNGAAGGAWVDAQESLDRLFAPFERMLVEAVSAEASREVLDVGCGTGATTVAIARALGANGRCTGIDISEPMVGAARLRSERESVPARFIVADAQQYPFEGGQFDMIVSRFGVMFFADAVEAFARLCHATAAGGALQFIAWRSPDENPFMTTAERAAAPLLLALPVRRADAPGQFAFASGDRVRTILRQAGWDRIDVHPIDVACTLPERELVPYFTRLGLVGRVLQDLDERTRTRVIETVRRAFDPYVSGEEVRFIAGCWVVTARAPFRSPAM